MTSLKQLLQLNATYVTQLSQSSRNGTQDILPIQETNTRKRLFSEKAHLLLEISEHILSEIF